MTLPSDSALIARAQTIAVLATYPVETLDPALSAPAPAAAMRDDARPLFRLPRPERWTALLATLALAAFFFVRRIV